MADKIQTISLTPVQYQSFNKRARNYTHALVGTPVGEENNPTGYTIPYDDYNNSYNQLKDYGLVHGSGIVSPQNLLAQQAPIAPAQTAAVPIKPIAAPPTYEQFSGAQSSGGSPIYNGGTPPGGMNPADAQMLQSIYAPKHAAGGFVPDAGFGAQPQGYADGGMPSSSEMASWVTRREAADSVPHTAGLFKSSVPGRTDKLDTLVPGGSYVLPADVVSGLGEGNTMAGAAVLDKMFGTMPYGIKPPHIGHGGVGIPNAPGAPHQQVPTRAEGGASPTRIIAAGGEYLVHPEAVKRLGGGDMKKGHKILDHFVVHARKKTAAEMNKLPGPKK